MPNRVIAPAGIAPPLGPYSMAIASDGPGTWLHIAGQVGIGPGGALLDGFEAQARQAWSNLAAVLAEAGMQMQHLVKVNTYLTRAADVPLLGPVRAAFMGEARPASTLVIVQALAQPQWLVEVEAVAFLPAPA
ncbi:RidA family protein [Bordetella petrii]|uniref:RidA family protein n=1 Tax=Bordetella petrii TaxID=94624 RepID=UPI001A9738F6|nr:RidA family protein [Bordetella petrii]MBO1114559.1 RidA family protein [Bordetella petrii]